MRDVGVHRPLPDEAPENFWIHLVKTASGPETGTLLVDCAFKECG
jgi:hypothetical protein